MKVRELIDALERLDKNSDIKLIHTNYGSFQEYEFVNKIITTSDNTSFLVVSPNSQIGYYDTDRTSDSFHIL